VCVCVYIPVILCGLEACPPTKSDLQSMDFVINRFFKLNSLKQLILIIQILSTIFFVWYAKPFVAKTSNKVCEQIYWLLRESAVVSFFFGLLVLLYIMLAVYYAIATMLWWNKDIQGGSKVSCWFWGNYVNKTQKREGTWTNTNSYTEKLSIKHCLIFLREIFYVTIFYV